MEGDGSQSETEERRRQLMDLDDLCLLLILKNLSPLPDLFHVAQTNQVGTTPIRDPLKPS